MERVTENLVEVKNAEFSCWKRNKIRHLSVPYTAASESNYMRSKEVAQVTYKPLEVRIQNEPHGYIYVFEKGIEHHYT